MSYYDKDKHFVLTFETSNVTTTSIHQACGGFVSISDFAI